MIEQLAGNALCWLMLLVAWFAYQQIFVLFTTRKEIAQCGGNKKLRDGEKELTKREMVPAVLVSALPLMGLLGTIAGLQVSFTGMMSLGVDSQVVTGGIADALFTTQLGLTLAIPGWLLLMFVNGAVKRAVAREA
ncbi:MAG: MotA/TolQ/ExbB proton channel family protein [Alteromonas macleodii]|jgi:biopolymer transport protein ExbB|uniref:MotA/TolQ/ExbB proton channel family protein n=1 Tax=Alteromonas TaxID=226 RepID=UPI0004505913|nr:MotA/TolQ/ExbB proton channel family protein [Alteromonas macleodii]MDM7964144.1 MotA/TolQ/ExbB proton channel family protein [Alteromonas macleodii]MDM8169379.1 MotA/TolQ/ExbB proton channel family protein [Alteromonas macleodii]CAI3968327.1 biopolymer transport protein ExbB [Alteromonas macleodii]VTP57621.1 biopolymer transport protein ExbB [Alteromonas macleodii]